MIGVYGLLFSDNKVYIGSTSVSIGGRFHSHLKALKRRKHFNIHVQRTFDKYGEPEFLILEECNDSKIVTILEQAWIDAQDKERILNFGPALPNAMFGKTSPMKGKKLSAETRKKMSISLKGNKNMLGKKLSDETKRKMSLAGKGKIITAETRKKLSELATGKIPTVEARKKMSEAQTGKKHPHSDETKRKISESHKGKTGRKWSYEAKRKISISLLGNTRRKDYLASKRVDMEMS